MMKERLQQEQKVAYRILENSLFKQNLGHAYLFVGEKGTPKFETAILLAQSLLCHQEGWACEVCDTCLRIQEGNYADVIIKDGEMNSIKKNDILSIQEQFSKTALEVSNKKIYILNRIENATIEALNALLKFLEEPSDDVVAILICEQQDKLLPTIVSRCQVIPFKKIPPNEILKQCQSMQMNELDAYLLSNLVGDLNQINEIIEDENYQCARYIAMEVIKKLLVSTYSALLFLQLEAFKEKKGNDRIQLNYVIEIILLFLKDCLKQQSECQSEEWLALIVKYKDMNCIGMLEVCRSIQDKCNKSVNIKLLVDQWMTEIRRCSHE